MSKYFIVISCFIYSQEMLGCGTDKLWEDLIIADPSLIDNQINFENSLYDFTINRVWDNNLTKTIPVVVHIVYENEDENI